LKTAFLWGITPPRYFRLRGEVLTAISRCIPKSKTSERLAAFGLIKEAAKLGAQGASEEAAAQWTRMSASDRKQYASVEEVKASLLRFADFGAKLSKPGVRIGMTKAQAMDTSWGLPQKINKTTDTNGTREQGVYG